jgi:uncharacterized protein YkwD
MDIRTWQEAGIRAGAYTARHRGRSPFSPLRPAPIAIGSLSTAAIAAFAFVAPGILHGSPAGSGSTLLDGAPNRVAPFSSGSSTGAAPGFVSVTAPTSTSSSSDAPATPSSSATSASSSTATSSSPSPFTEHTSATSTPAPQPSQPSLSQPSSSAPPTGQPPTAPPSSTATTPVPPPPSSSTSAPAPFDGSAAVAAGLGEIAAARDQEGVDQLSVDRLLTKAAGLHSADMARTGDFSHIGSDGSDPFSRAARVGCLNLSQELIAHGKPGDDVIGALLRDPASRRALVSFWNTGIGVSAQLDPTTGDVYWTIELGWL